MSPGIPTRLLAVQSDERLLVLIREGHERAFEALVRRYRVPLLSYCRRLPLPDARAEDVIQLALLKTWIAVREGIEVRDLKAWLYRVVHNTALNAAREAAREREPVAHAAQGSRAHLHLAQPEIDLGLRAREALAEVAALPTLQREVMVRTAVAGHSHERVASDLGISDGAVRGLLYRARSTLRRAVAALTPPPLLGWIAGRADQSPPAPERLAELVGGGGTVGLGGLLAKGGVVAVTAGTMLTGAAIVHLSGSPHHPRHHLVAAVPARSSASGPAGLPSLTASGVGLADPPGRSHDAGRGGSGHGALGRRGRGGSQFGGAAIGGRAPRFTVRAGGGVHRAPSGSGGAVPGVAPPSGGGQVVVQGGASGQSGTAGQAGGPGAGQSASVSLAGGASTGAGAPPAGQSAAGGGPPGGSQPGGGSGQSGSGQSGSGPSGSGQSSSGPSGSESPSGAGSSGGGEAKGGAEPPSGSGESGSLVGTVAHAVGGLLEHVLH
jgi:RNA polymerase sigma factor (sigma-70 family)